MPDGEQTWKEDLSRALKEIGRQYVTDKFPATVETQREYHQGLFLIEEEFSKRMDAEDRGEWRGYDSGYRRGKLAALDEQERVLLARTTSDKAQWALRGDQQSERDDLSGEKADPAYRKSQSYRDGMQEIVERQAERREQIDQAIRTVEELLNARFGFARSRSEPGRDR